MEQDRSRKDSVDVSDLVVPVQDGGFTMESVKVMAYFLLYSMAMFTLPFIAYVGTKYGFKHYFGVDGFANTVWSVVAAVVVVNVIIMMYACKGFYEVEDEQMDREKREADKKKE